MNKLCFLLHGGLSRVATTVFTMLVVVTPLVGQSPVAYRAGTVYTMAGEPLSPGVVVVAKGKIVAVGKSPEIPAGAKEVDMGDQSVLMPGLVNAYSQSPLSDDSQAEITEEVTPDFRAVQAIDWTGSNLRRLLNAGTTTINVCPGTDNVIGGLATIIKSDPQQRLIINEEAALMAAMCNDPSRRNQSRSRPDSIYVRQPTNRMGVVWILRNTMNKAVAGDPTLETVQQAISGKRPLMIVSRMSHDIHTVGTLADEFEFSPILIGGQEAYKIRDLVAERKYPLILQPLATGSLTGEERSDVCWNQAGVLMDAGLTVAISGDDLLGQARFAHRYGLPADQALAAVTSTPAKILGLEQRVGSIVAGHDADLIALSGDPLEITSSIRWVMVNGTTIEITKDP